MLSGLDYKTTRNILAIILALGFLILRCLGINHFTEWMMISIAGTYGLIPAIDKAYELIRKDK